MSLFFESALPVSGEATIHVDVAWNPRHPLIAIGSFSEDQGGFVSVFEGENGREVSSEIPAHPTAQVTALAWHPTEKRILAVGWESGEVSLSVGPPVDSLHRASVHILRWSALGTRLISADKNGSVVGWELSSDQRLRVVFHHELKDPLVGLCFCSGSATDSSSISSEIDISGLARAAVAGDEQALDLFSSSWRPGGSNPKARLENLNAYAGSQSGLIYYLNENGSCLEVLQAEGAVKTLLHQQRDSFLVVVTENMVIGQFQIDEDGTLTELSKVKMSTRSKENHITWCGHSLLAITSGDTSVRIWNLKTDDNFVLSANEPQTAKDIFITSLSFSERKHILAAGTNKGQVLMWKRDDSEWRILPVITVSITIKDITWGGSENVLAVNTVRQVFLLKEQKLCSHYYDGVSALQSNPTSVKIYFHGKEDEEVASAASGSMQIKGCFLSEKNIILWGDSKVVTFEIQKEIAHLMQVGEFTMDCDKLVTHEKNIYTLEGDRINVRSFQGTIKQTLNFNEVEGRGICISIVRGDFLVAGTANGFVRIWDLMKRDARPHVHPINLNELIQDMGEILEAKCNSKGTHLSVSRTTSNGTADPKLYILELESNVLHYFNFASGRNDVDDSAVPPNSPKTTVENEDNGHNSQSRNVVGALGRFVVKHEWDFKEPHLLVSLCRSNDDKDILVSLFVHDDFGIVVHDNSSFQHKVQLISVDIPYMILIRENKDSEVAVERFTMKDFVGLESSDKFTRDAVVKFSFYLSIGNMDEAFKSIKTVKNPKVWGNMARMCVKNQRLDVAAICLGNMQLAYGARAIRQLENSKVHKDVKTAILAIHLDMPEEAERLLVQCGRYDLLNKVYQDSGQWQKAIQIAEEHDRMHLRTTYYNYAKHLESRGDIAGAIQNYEKSGTQRFEVPRLLFEDWTLLESYIIKSNDKQLKRWWAQYMESTGEMEIALQYYDLAEDYLSLVRVYCYCDNLEKASEIASRSGDKAACYHLARQYENIDDITKAIHFFTKANAYSNAIRICKEHGFVEQLWNLALLATSNEKLEAAKYFENCEKPQYDKAVILYEKAGYLGKALDLAFKTNQHNVLQFISSNLDDNTDPAILEKTAMFFLENEQYEKAVDLFAASGQHKEALDLCLKYNINITEALADKLTKSRQDIELLNQLAEVCYQQGNYHLATKKWTQAGNRLKAMKALLKSGDTEKIIFFANVSRERDIYILAGNYLQTLDWRNNAEIMKNIITFYTKSKAYDMLAWFYTACADVEIDEYQNYEKALGALSEGLKCLKKCEQTPQVETRMEEISRNINFVSMFVEYQKKYQDNPKEAIEGCKQLLLQPEINSAVRKGDIYGFMIEHYVRSQNHKMAINLIDDLRTAIPNVNLAYYVNSDALLSIDKAMGTRLLEEKSN